MIYIESLMIYIERQRKTGPAMHANPIADDDVRGSQARRARR